MLGRIYMQILDMTLQAGFVIVVVMLARLLLKRAPKVFSYMLWAVVLLRLLCPVAIEAPVSVVPDIESVSESYTLQDQPITFFSAGSAAYHAVGDALNGGLGIQHIYTSEMKDSGMPRIVTASWWEVWILFGQYVWLAGIAGLLLYSAVTYLKLRRKLMGASPVQNNIYLADHIDSPFVLGLIRPKIYLPSALNTEERKYIIAHEQHHIRRLDHIVKMVAYLALALHWFNPLVWIAYILFCKDMEMSCDEAVIRELGEEIRADYSASLLNLATGRRMITITPLAFGEGDTTGRIKNLSRWKKPLTWVIVVSVIVCVAVAVCLLTDPLGSSYSRIEKIVKQKGYSIIDQSTEEITLTFSTENLPDSIYSKEGHAFADGEVIVYGDDTATIFLKSVQYSNEGPENLYFCFDFSFNLPKDGGSTIYPFEVKRNGYTDTVRVSDGVLRTESHRFENAVGDRGQGPFEKIWFYVSTDVLKQITGEFAFDVRINQITYLKDGAVKDILTSYVGPDSASTLSVSESSSASDESQFILEVSLPKTDFSKPGQTLTNKIAAEWKAYDGLTQQQRMLSSHLWGTIYIDTNTWEQCEQAIGVEVCNPLESVDWITKTGYIGSESAEPSMPITHVKATAYATAASDRKLSRIDMTSGYNSEGVRITLTATVCTQDRTFTDGMVRQGYAIFESEDAFTGSGLPVIVVTPNEENNTGYYNEGYYDQVAYWVEGNIFYTLHVVGENESRTGIQNTLKKLLAEI